MRCELDKEFLEKKFLIIFGGKSFSIILRKLNLFGKLLSQMNMNNLKSFCQKMFSFVLNTKLMSLSYFFRPLSSESLYRNIMYISFYYDLCLMFYIL